MENEKALLFAFDESRALGEVIARESGLALVPLEDRRFPDGEYKVRPLVSPAGHHAVIVQSLFGDARLSVDEKLCRLLFLISTLKDAGAHNVTAIVPYLCYARKDRRTHLSDPLTNRYISQLLEAAGLDRIVTLAVHNLQAFENAFRCNVVHVPAFKLFVDYLGSKLEDEEMAVLSPDIGGIKRVTEFHEALQCRLGEAVGLGFMEKKRRHGVITGEEVIHGDVAGRTVIIYDDIIASGKTMERAARAARSAGAKAVIAAAAHGLFVEQADQVFGSQIFDELVITNSVTPFRLTNASRKKLKVLSTELLFVEALQTAIPVIKNIQIAAE